MLDLKEEFDRRDNKTMKVAELKKVEWGSRAIVKFIYEFRRVAKVSKYEEKLLVEKFKRGMNGVVRQKLIESEYLPRSIE